MAREAISREKLVVLLRLLSARWISEGFGSICRWLCRNPVAQVVAVQDRNLGEAPFAFIEPHPDATWTQEEIALFCTERLARFKTPREFHLVREWPMTGVGKIQKVTLHDWAAEIWRKSR